MQLYLFSRRLIFALGDGPLKFKNLKRPRDDDGRPLLWLSLSILDTYFRLPQIRMLKSQRQKSLKGIRKDVVVCTHLMLTTPYPSTCSIGDDSPATSMSASLSATAYSTPTRAVLKQMERRGPELTRRQVGGYARDLLSNGKFFGFQILTIK